jgi:hypothetical protein
MNPFDLVYDALWQMVLDSTPMSELVKPGNIIRYDQTSRDPYKKEVATEDLPELVLTSEGADDINMHATSCTSMLRRTYAFMISTGDFRLQKILHPVEWALFCSMSDFRSRLGSLQWEGENFVKEANFVSVLNGTSDPDKNRGIRGWSAVWRCRVAMHFRTASLRAYTAGGS